MNQFLTIFTFLVLTAMTAESSPMVSNGGRFGGSAKPAKPAKSCSVLINQCQHYTGCTEAFKNVIHHCPLDELPLSYSSILRKNRQRRPHDAIRRSRSTTTSGYSSSTIMSTTTRHTKVTCGDMSELCTDALAALLTVEDDLLGANFMNCSCDGVEECEKEKLRLSECVPKPSSRHRFNAPDHGEMLQNLSCSFAAFYCTADTGCFTTMSLVQRDCANLFTYTSKSRDRSPIPQCSAACNHSVNLLMSRHRGQHLRHCTCNSKGSKGSASESCAYSKIKQFCDFQPAPQQIIATGTAMCDVVPLPVQPQTNNAANAFSRSSTHVIWPLAAYVLHTFYF